MTKKKLRSHPSKFVSYEGDMEVIEPDRVTRRRAGPRWTVAEVKRRKARGEVIPPEIEAAFAEATRDMSAAFREEFERWLRSGEPAADWALLVMPDTTEREYLTACDRILTRLGPRPVHPKRWWRLRAAAEELGVTVEGRARDNAWEAARIVVAKVADLDVPEVTAAVPELRRRFRNVLTSLLMTDLLGPGWSREEAGPLDVEVLPASDDPRRRAEAQVTVARLADAAGLTPTRRATLEAWLASGGDVVEMTRLLSAREGRQLAEGTVRKRKHDLEARLRRVRSP